MSTTGTCPDCGSPLPADAPQGLCPQCLAQAALKTQSSTASPPSPDQTLTIDASSVVEVSPTIRYFGDYELIQEIARGGMGVVYKARQKSLHRIVAVKMILAGQLAGDVEVKRFRTEAEAAANLQHPNIVAIHEIGEHEGRHYFSMDYVDGPSLASGSKEGPMPAIKAAELVKTLAEAIQFAHQRGILHRDLKPHNVLIDSRGIPRITDFGLAKQVNQESSLTTEGAVMGSPSYMPPEQAAGRQDLVGPASDVYSLGAILYELLTGQPPFRGKTAMETVRQVIDNDPAPPSKLNSKLPSDLETICLKCLEKKPDHRYSSARMLAEELGRFLNHEPIWARPASSFRKAGAWIQRHPWMITAALAAVVLGVSGLAFGFWDRSRYLVWLQTHAAPKTPASGVWFIVSFVLAVPLGMGLAAFVFVDFVDRKRRFSVLARHLKVYAVLAFFEMAVSVNSTLAMVHEWIWRSLRAENTGKISIFAFACFSAAWFGALLLLNVIKEYRRLQFGVERKDEEVLFPPQPKEVLSTIGQRKAFNLVILAVIIALVFVNQASALISIGTHTAWWFAQIAMYLAMACPAFSWWRGTRDAGKHFIFFLGVLCLLFSGLGAYKLSTDPIFRGTFLVPGTPWIALGLGLALGGFIVWVFQRAGAIKAAETTVETADYSWVNASHGALVLMRIAGYFALAMTARFWSSSQENAGHWPAFFTFLLVLEVAFFRRASGQERKARGQTIAVLLLAVLAASLGIPMEQMIREVLAGLLLGTVLLGFVVWKSRGFEDRALPSKSLNKS